MKHTKGEWKVRFIGEDAFIEAIEPKNHIGKIEILMEDWGEHNGYPKEQRDADAKLIAAAPSLLKALNNMLTVFEGDIMHPQGSIEAIRCSQAREAIKKATS